MKMIYKIARNELRNLFFSPIAWLVLLIFTIQVGIKFVDFFEAYLLEQSLEKTISDLTDRIYANGRGLFIHVQSYLYLYIPLLTMGLMSREYSNGSFKLLYSSPITNFEIIVGKFLSMIIYVLILMGILSIFVIFGMFTIKDFDLPYALTGLSGLFLLASAYSAIGLFMSCLTSYQVVAAMYTLAIFATLNFIGDIGQTIPIFREITFWLSMRGRATEMISGLICSEDVIYFLIIIFTFLALSILYLKFKRRKRNAKKEYLSYAVVIIVAVTIGYVSFQPSMKFFHDSTAAKMRTLTENSQEVMKQLKGDVTITTYVNLLDDYYELGLPKNLNRDKRVFRQFIRFKPDIKMKYVYYYDKSNNESLDQRFPGASDEERAKYLAENLKLNFKKFLNPEQIREKINLTSENNRFVRLIEYENGNSTFLRVFDDSSVHPNESQITAGFKRLLGQVFKVGFLSGHGERDIEKRGDNDYYRFSIDKLYRSSLVNNGFDCQIINLTELENKIPDDIDILIIGDVKFSLNEGEVNAVKEFIDKGGNLLITCEPHKQKFINPILQHVGVRLLDGQIYQVNENHNPELVLGKITEEGAKLCSKYSWMKRWNYNVVMSGATGLEVIENKDFEITFVVTTESGKYKLLMFNEEIDLSLPDEEEIPLIINLERKVGDKNQRITIYGDADCISNGEISMRRRGVKSENYNFLTQNISWLTEGQLPVDVSRTRHPDNKIYMKIDNLIWVKLFFFGFLPMVFVISYLMIYFNRKKR